MKKTDEDLRKGIDDLEKLIEEVKKENHKEIEKLKKETRPAGIRQIRIDLATEYSPSPPLNFVVGFLVNFILFFFFLELVGLAEADGVLVYAGLAAAFTVYETLIRRYFFKHQVKVVLYSSGLIFFLLHLVFFYLADLVVLPQAFSFYAYWYPIAFIAAFTVLRFFIKFVYAGAVRTLSGRAKRK